MRASVLLASLLLVTTGCIGMGGDDADDTTDDQSVDGQDPGTNASTNGTSGGDHAHEPAPERHTDERTGEIEQTNLVVGTNGEPANETFQIPDTTTKLVFNLSADSGEINGEIYPPDCEDNSPNTIGAECSHDLNTYNSSEGASAGDGGEVSWSTEDPTGGNWTVQLYKADPGTSSVPYTLTAFYVDKHTPGSDHHS